MTDFWFGFLAGIFVMLGINAIVIGIILWGNWEELQDGNF